jgi:hypothetical protein
MMGDCGGVVAGLNPPLWCENCDQARPRLKSEKDGEEQSVVVGEFGVGKCGAGVVRGFGEEAGCCG